MNQERAKWNRDKAHLKPGRGEKRPKQTGMSQRVCKIKNM